MPDVRDRRSFWLRVLLAGPLVILTSVVVMLGGALWLPQGAAEIDHLMLPIVLFPAIWAVLFFSRMSRSKAHPSLRDPRGAASR
jgi:hypothetical protein